MSRSGTVEPTWPTEDGARVTEYSSLPGDTTITPPSIVDDGGPGVPPSGIRDRYDVRINQ